MTKSTRPPGRFTRLDILRCGAVLAVLLHHLVRPALNQIVTLRSTLEFFHTSGWVGVDLFFVLSGFLVSGLLFDEHQRSGTVSFTRFLIRRGLKIYPCYYLFVCLVACHFYLAGKLEFREVLPVLALVPNYFPNFQLHLWSIGVEEHFYVLLCLFFAWRLHRQPKDPWRGLPLAFTALAFVCLALRIWTQSRLAVGEFAYQPTHLRIDSLAFGVLLAWAIRYRRPWLDRYVGKQKWRMTGLAALLLIPMVFDRYQYPWIATVFGFAANYLAFGLILLLTFYWPVLPSKVLQRLGSAAAFVGRHSYSIYLWHRSCQGFITPYVLRALHWSDGWPFTLIYLASSLGFGIAVSVAVEWPILRWRDRHFPAVRTAGSGGLRRRAA